MTLYTCDRPMSQKWLLLLRYHVVAYISFGKKLKKNPKNESKSCSSWQDLRNLVRLGKKSKIFLVRLAMIVENLAKFGISWQDILPRSCQEIAKSKINLAKTNKIPSTGFRNRIFFKRIVFIQLLQFLPLPIL